MGYCYDRITSCIRCIRSRFTPPLSHHLGVNAIYINIAIKCTCTITIILPSSILYLHLEGLSSIMHPSTPPLASPSRIYYSYCCVPIIKHAWNSLTVSTVNVSAAGHGRDTHVIHIMQNHIQLPLPLVAREFNMVTLYP